jgi:hypothetical protein
MMEFTAELIVAVVSAAISLALDVVPGLAERWEALPKEAKRFAWLIGCLVVGLVPWLMACVGIQFWVIVGCTVIGLAESLELGFLAYFASQATHGLFKAGYEIIVAPGLPGNDSDEPLL